MERSDRRIEAVAFDFDGVVIDSEPLYEKAERKLFDEIGIVVPDQDWKNFKGISENEFYKTLKNLYGISVKLNELREHGRDLLLREFENGLDYMEGFLPFLDYVSSNYKTGLVTSTSIEILSWIFKNTKINNHFKYIITADSVKNKKPHPDPYIEICGKMDVEPENVVVIEDSIHGVNSAVSAGAITIGFTSSLSEADLENADYFAGNFNEVRELLEMFGT